MSTILIRYGVAEATYRRLLRLRDGLERKAKLRTYRADITERVAMGAQTQDRERVRAAQVVRGAVDEQVLVLCRRAIELLEGGPKARNGVGLGSFVVLGGAAFDWLGYPSLLIRYGDIVPRMIRRGSPDPNLSLVIAPAMQVALEAARRGVAGTNDPAALAKIRAFGMGMITSIAADVVVGPVARGASLVSARARRDDGAWLDPAVATRVDRLVRAYLLGDAPAAALNAALPPRFDIPDALIDGLLGAVADVVHAFDDAQRPRGYPDFEAALHPAPLPTRATMAEVYTIVRDGIEPWGFGDWWVYLLPFALSLIAPVPIAAAPDWKASRLFRKAAPGAPGADEESVGQFAVLAQSLATIGPSITTFLLRSKLPGPTGPFDAGIAAMVGDVVMAVLMAISTTGSWPGLVRWLFAILPWIGRIAFLAYAINEAHPPLRAYYWIQTFPLFASLFGMIIAGIFAAITGGASDPGDGWLRFGLTLLGYGVIVLIVQCVLAGVLSGRGFLDAIGALRPALELVPDADRPRLAGLPAAIDPAAPPAGAGSPVGPAAVFDESVLWIDGAPIDLAALRYPPGDRPLLRVWWTGAGTLELSPAGDRVRARIVGVAGEQLVVLPPIPMTPAALAAFLVAQVTGRAAGDAAAEHALHAEPFVDGATAAATHRLPYPQLIENAGGVFTAIGVDRDRAYPLRNARRAHVATALGVEGPVVTAAEGWPVAPGPGALGDDGTAVGFASELATLLALGGASRLHPGRAKFQRPPNQLVEGDLPAPVSQVFRRWNLDERRANEWRTLVGGGAWSEKAAPVAAAPGVTVARDVGQLPDAAATSVPVDVGAVDVAERLGWLPAFRAWARVAIDLEEDTSATTAAPYTPIAAMADRPRPPTNRELNEVMRYLLDLPR